MFFKQPYGCVDSSGQEVLSTRVLLADVGDLWIFGPGLRSAQGRSGLHHPKQ